MATEISQFQLHALFGNPTEFYELMISRKGYVPKQLVEFDAELVAPSWTSMGCVLLCAMAHHERKAFVILLDSSDCTALRDSLEQQQIAVNAAQLFARPRLGFGSGL
jgi:hypothetical protein